MAQASHQLTTRFIDYLRFERRYSPHTVRAYQDDLQEFFGYVEAEFGETPLPGITAGIVRTWLAGLKDKKLTSKTINRKISSLKSFFRYQLKMGEVTKSPMTQVTMPKVTRRLPVYVEKKEMNLLLAATEAPAGASKAVAFSPGWKGNNERLILQLLYHTGMRLAELIGLRENQLDAYRGTLRIIGKGNKERVVPVHQNLVQALKQYIVEKARQLEMPDRGVLLVTEKGKPLYPKYVYRIVTTFLGDVSTLDKRSPHVLRHTFATHLTNSGADLNAVKELLGHASLAATQVYTHNTIEKLQKAHQKAHPKA